MCLTKRILLLSFLLLPVQGVWAIDTDNDGSASDEESLAGTSDNDPTQRPYWWKTLNGDSEGDELGTSVSDAGDVNGDGHADLIVGAPFDDNNGDNSGSARVFSGLDGSMLYTFNGDTGDWLGHSVSGAGDVNGDGYADLIVGAYQDDNNGNNSGSARVFSGVNGSILYTFNGDSADDLLGESVSGAGDVDGDGHADLIVGAYGDDNNGPASGSARVFSGLDGSILYTFNGDSAFDYLGASVSGAGDVNGDGYADLIVGAYQDDNNGNNSGSARVFSGVNGSILYTFNGDSAYDRLGFSVSGAGDVNGDGYADLIVGAPFDNNLSGSARVFSGLDGSMLYTFNGDFVGNAFFGTSVSDAGDVNGDGVADLIVGAQALLSEGLPYAQVFSGLNGSILYDFFGDSAGDSFGVSVSGAGDVDGDGYDDLIVGATYDDNNGADSGSARVFLSSDLMNDSDLDYHLDTADNCPVIPNPDQADSDLDGVGDQCDNCPSASNANQLNTEGDWQGDACDLDDDNDSQPDTGDNCPLNANPDQADGDNDGIGDVCDPTVDPDTDGDSVPDNVDNCPAKFNPNQANSDGDEFGNKCDPDFQPPPPGC